ncbi:MAG: OmpA family protein [Helicobacteraceae bacterium]|jgi:peptidoglycan-associated lipoprotein|nr:OmpA family protein [Helicobacteraceae bacterium]
MKKLIFTGILATTLIALAGCGSKAEVVPSEETTTTEEDTTTVEDGDEVTTEGVEELEGDEDTATYSGEKLPVVYFDFDRFEIRADQQDSISDIASAVSGGGATFRIEGNCDEWGTEEYNYALGLKRAKSVQDALVRAGVSESQLTLISYGESNPVCAQSNANCWRENRRVEVTVLP